MMNKKNNWTKKKPKKKLNNVLWEYKMNPNSFYSMIIKLKRNKWIQIKIERKYQQICMEFPFSKFKGSISSIFLDSKAR